MRACRVQVISTWQEAGLGSMPRAPEGLDRQQGQPSAPFLSTRQGCLVSCTQQLSDSWITLAKRMVP